MRWDVFVWAAAALLLMAAETLVPGAFLLWLGFAAAAVFLIVLVLPGTSLLLQVAAFVVLSFVSIAVYRKWFRGRERQSDRPTLNQRAAHHIGRQVVLERAIEGGVGRVKIGDAYWTVSGPPLPVGSVVRVVGVDGMNLVVVPDG
ncbi:NfeD family protein [Luteimonas sp. e5]